MKAEDVAGPSCSSAAEGTPPKAKKSKKAPPRVYEPCGRGLCCTCAICRKAREQQVGSSAAPPVRLHVLFTQQGVTAGKKVCLWSSCLALAKPGLVSEMIPA